MRALRVPPSELYGKIEKWASDKPSSGTAKEWTTSLVKVVPLHALEELDDRVRASRKPTKQINRKNEMWESDQKPSGVEKRQTTSFAKIVLRGDLFRGKKKVDRGPCSVETANVFDPFEKGEKEAI